jgi:hypothetical protein
LSIKQENIRKVRVKMLQIIKSEKKQAKEDGLKNITSEVVGSIDLVLRTVLSVGLFDSFDDANDPLVLVSNY